MPDLPLWTWIALGACVVLGAGLTLVAGMRRRRLRDRFGPEYERPVVQASTGGEELLTRKRAGARAGPHTSRVRTPGGS